jgi:hypothetical protein
LNKSIARLSINPLGYLLIIMKSTTNIGLLKCNIEYLKQQYEQLITDLNKRSTDFNKRILSIINDGDLSTLNPELLKRYSPLDVVDKEICIELESIINLRDQLESKYISKNEH